MVEKLMAILAHPDDESLGNGGMLAKYAAEGIEIHLVVATRGERGWPGKESEYQVWRHWGNCLQADQAAARTILKESMERARGQGEKRVIAYVLEGWAYLAASRGEM